MTGIERQCPTVTKVAEMDDKAITEWSARCTTDRNETVQSHKYAEVNCGTSSYDVKAVATIEGNQELRTNLHFQTIATADIVCVAVDENCFIFDGNMQKCELNMRLESVITCFGVSPESDFILICCGNGTVTLLYRPQNRCVLTRTLTRKNEEAVESIICSAVFTLVDPNSGICEIMISTNTGPVFHLGNINLVLLRSHLENNDEESMLHELSKIEQSEISFISNDISSSQFGDRDLVLLSGDGIELLSKDTGYDFEVLNSIDKDVFLGNKIVKSAFCNNCRYAVLLDERKTIHLICLKTFIILQCWNEIQVEDFTLFENAETSSDHEVVKIFIKTRIDDQFILQLCSLPSFELIYSLPVTSETHLFTAASNVENLLFLERDVDVSKITIYSAFEASPHSRLLRLIGKQNFDEALLFADTFKLDVELVYRSKLKVLLDQLCNVNNLKLALQLMQEKKSSLYDCFDHISDIQTVVNYCINATLPSLSDTKEILNCAKAKVKKDFAFDSDVSGKLFEMAKRLETFNLLYGDHNWSSLWSRFKSANLWDELVLYLRQGDIANVSLLWARHCEEFILTMNDSDVLYLLESIPELPIVTALKEWLNRCLLPMLLRRVGGSIKTVASWVIHRCHLMEFIDSNNWPRNAIDLANMFIDVCKEQSCDESLESLNFSIDLAILFSQEISHSSTSVLRQIRLLLDNLHDLDQLKQQFNCKISLANYSQEDKRLVVYDIFEWFYMSDDIANFVTQFLTPFAKNNSLNIDIILENYIKDVLDSTEIDWRYWEEAPWEKQVVAIINCIKSNDHRLEALYQVLKVAPVPWTSSIQKMVHEALKSTHHLVEFIKIEKAVETRRVIMNKYGFYQSDAVDGHPGNTLICHILTTSDDRAIEDALTIAEAIESDPVDVYLFRMRHLIKTNRLQDFFQMLECIPLTIAIPCCKRLGLFVVGLNSSGAIYKEFLVERLNFTSAAIYGLQYLQKKISSFEFEEYRDLLDVLLKSRALQEFGVFVPLSMLESTRDASSTFCDCVEKFLLTEEIVFTNCILIPECIETERKTRKVKRSVRDLFWVAKLLNISKLAAAEMIIDLAIKLKKFDVAVDAFLKLCDESANRCWTSKFTTLIFFIIENLCLETKLSDLSLTKHRLERLNSGIAEVAVSCNPDEISSIASVKQWINLIQQILNASNLNMDILQGLNQDSFRYIFSTVFQETTIYLDYERALFLIGMTIQKFIKVKSTATYTEDFQVISTLFADLVEYLISRGRILLCYNIHVIQLFESCLAGTVDDQHTPALLGVAKRTGHMASSLIRKLLSQKKWDKLLTLAMILSLPKHLETSLFQKIEKRCGCDYGKLFIVASLGIEVCRRWGIYDDLPYYQHLMTEAEWGKILSRLHINYKGFFRRPASEKMNLIPVMAVDKKVTLSLIKKFSTAFGLASDVVLSVMLKVLLTSCNDQESLNRRSFNDSLTLCSAIIDQIPYTECLVSTFDEIYSKVDPYNYEAIEFIIKSTSSIDANDTIVFNNLKLLTFLRSYERKSEPLDFETPFWLETNLEVYSRERNSCLKRLPYHHLLDPLKARKIIVNELVPETLDSWMELSDIVSISKNDMVMITIENLFKQVIPGSETSKMMLTKMLWTDNVVTNSVFVTVHNLLKCIDDLEKATVCLISIIKRLPPGISKVLAVKSAIEFSENWSKSGGDKRAENTLKILKKMLRNLSTEQLIHELQLNVDCSSLRETPEKLLILLLEHDSIEKRYWFNSDRYPDVFGACKTLAGYHNLNMDELGASLLYKWLVPAEYIVGSIMDETLTMDLDCSRLSGDPNENSTSQRDNLKRAIYLLRQLNTEESVGYLVTMLQSNLASISQGDKFNYLSCLLHTQDIQSLQVLLGFTDEELRRTAKQFYCGKQLESINLSYLMQEFSEGPTITNSIIPLIHSYGHKPTAVLFVAESCLDNKFYDATVWGNLLKCMTVLKLYKPLVRVLCGLSVCPAIITLPVYIQAWKFVLTNSDNDEEDFGLRKLMLIQKCPVLEALDIVSLAKFYEEAALPILAVESYLHLPDHIGQSQIKEFMNISTSETILLQIIAITDQVGDLYHMNEIWNVIILALTSNGIIKKCWKGPNKVWLKRNIFSDKHFTNILLYAARKQKWVECCELIKLSEEGEEANNTTAKTESKCSNLDAKSVVKIYAELHQLECLLEMTS